MNVLSYNKRKFLPYLPLYLIFLSNVVISIRDYEEIETSPVSLGVIHKIISLIVAFCFIFVYILYNKKLTIKLPLPLKLYLYYLMLGFFSLSQAQIVGYSIWKLFEVVTTFIFAIYIIVSSAKQPKVGILWYEKTLRIILIIVLLALVGLIINPTKALAPPTSKGEAFLNYQLNGYIINTNPNSLGLLASILLMVSICRLYLFNNRKNYWLTIFLLSFFVMVLSQSRTSWMAFAVSLATFIILSQTKIQYKIFSIIVIILVIYFFTNPLLLYLQRGSSESLIMSGSGRVDMWIFAWDIIKEHKITGLGFGEGSRAILSIYGAGTTSTLHSDYLDAAASVGILGPILIFCIFLTSLFYILRNYQLIKLSYPKNYWIELLLIILMLWVRSLTGITISSLSYFCIIFFIVIAVAYIGIQGENS
jgi:O-antigen ligase